MRAFLKRITLAEELITGAFILVAAVFGGALFLLYQKVSALDAELLATATLLQHTLAEATTTFSSALQAERKSLEEQLGGVKERVGDLGGTVEDLEKLTTTDPELLAKYSKVFFLNENYSPERLVDVPEEYRYTEGRLMQVIPEILPFLEDMLDEAKGDAVEIYVDSAYRSFNSQGALKGQYTITYGSGTASQFSADQGYSEHQLGTTVDLITKGTGGSLTGFDKTPAYTWLLENAHRYGFILSYPPNNGYYVFEPWHWRFVGVKLATYLHKKNLYFYNLDQRTIDNYLISLFD